MARDLETLCEGKHLVFRRRDGWEFVEHRTAGHAAMIVAVTPDSDIVLVEEFRPALDAHVISLPAGLVGDEGPEEPLHAAARELREETGFDAEDFEHLTSGPGSAGASSEIVHFFLARGVRRSGEQSAQDKAQIRVHVIPLASLSSWAKERESEGRWIDPKVWAGVFFAGEARARGALTSRAEKR